MANPNSITNGQGREIDPLPNTAGAVKLKLAVGTKAVAGATDDAAWQGVATHTAGASIAAADGVALVATGAVGGTAQPVSAANPMPVSDAGGSLTVDGAVTVSGTVTTTPPANATTDITKIGGAAVALGTAHAAASIPVELSNDGVFATAAGTNGSGAGAGVQVGGTPGTGILGWLSSAVAHLLAIKTLLPGFGTAGSPSTNVSSVQGVAGGTANKVSATAAISQTPTVTASGIYASGDAVGGLLTFANVNRANGEGCVIGTVTVVDLAAQSASLELWLFKATFTAMADNAPWAVSDADVANCIGVIPISSYYASTLNSVGQWTGAFLAVPAVGTLFGQLVTRSTPTYASTTDIRVTLKVIPD